MAGSYTAYHELVLIAKKDIQAGQELFVDQTRRAAYPRKIKDLPSTEDYTKADAIVQQLANVHLELTDAQWTDLLYRMKHEIMEESDKGAIKVFPNTRQQFQRAVEFGTAGMELQERNMDWIQSNGMYAITCAGVWEE